MESKLDKYECYESGNMHIACEMNNDWIYGCIEYIGLTILPVIL